MIYYVDFDTKKVSAYRILHYCLAYIESEKPEATPTIDKLITQKIAKDIKK